MILSPSTAASIASWMVEKSPGTRRIAGGGGAGAAFLGAPIRQTVATARRIHFMGEAPSNCGSLRDRRDGCCGCEQNPSSREEFPARAQPIPARRADASRRHPGCQPTLMTGMRQRHVPTTASGDLLRIREYPPRTTTHAARDGDPQCRGADAVLSTEAESLHETTTVRLFGASSIAGWMLPKSFGTRMVAAAASSADAPMHTAAARVKPMLTS